MAYDPICRWTFADGLKAARNRAGLSATKAAARIAAMGIQCSPGALLSWERGRGSTREPFASNLTVIASVYGCTVNELFNQPGSNND